MILVDVICWLHVFRICVGWWYVVYFAVFLGVQIGYYLWLGLMCLVGKFRLDVVG